MYQNKTRANDSAYPLETHDSDENGRGLTKREYFAALILQGSIAGGINQLSVQQAVEVADNLIGKLNGIPTDL